jgi:hypothetical protein
LYPPAISGRHKACPYRSHRRGDRDRIPNQAGNQKESDDADKESIHLFCRGAPLPAGRQGCAPSPYARFAHAFEDYSNFKAIRPSKK